MKTRTKKLLVAELLAGQDSPVFRETTRVKLNHEQEILLIVQNFQQRVGK